MGKPRPSTIRKLPAELRSEIDRLLADGSHTIDDVVSHLRTLGANVSWSAVQRYSSDFERVAADIRMAREMATAIGRELEAVEGDSGRMVIESLQALLLRARMQLSTSDELDAGAVAQLARSAKDLQSALKLNVDVEIKVRDRALKDAAVAAEEAAASQGLSSETVELIKARILGIRKEAHP